MAKHQVMDKLSLGKQTQYPTEYDASQLHPVPRSINRQSIGIDNDNALPFSGGDLWNGYELSWLNTKGLPQVAVGRFWVPADSPNLIESKSFKLYLNSFNESRFDDWQTVTELMVSDLSACAGATVNVQLFSLNQLEGSQLSALPGHCIDQQDITIDQYDYDQTLLTLQPDAQPVSETLHSHLLKSNCLITHQPDWGSVVIRYQGPALDQQALLKYLVSFRRHDEFHEQCVERIFQDILALGMDKLTVYANYTRRGGLDINPFRSNFEQPQPWLRLPRQ
ncbi:NADPH-dependent 7-cyano-7-deazaguanine reductase QueF [Idiomarina tyrosinivorans]|uniref:NADPH-dependent 7-cyano-7-deazaguanine reductase n=1 Tax=Idiomarina tyrosinivorans TaxID=1445662 RepID=A0A432ZRN1_9GAMM|nr:NADPH-dependent 7-cyano-7-deazaguanine reductase QueF [Idiomarina tyrosinivorans]RUO80549.1 NADPH-dependent 7-cyano-7-deazaguanine reductase QueF [Idiomarina tyrosinivorans]